MRRREMGSAHGRRGVGVGRNIFFRSVNEKPAVGLLEHRAIGYFAGSFLYVVLNHPVLFAFRIGSAERKIAAVFEREISRFLPGRRLYGPAQL